MNTCKKSRKLLLHCMIQASLTFLLLSCSQHKDTIPVKFTASSGLELLSSPFFDDIQIIKLHGEGVPLLGPYTNMVVKNETYFIADPDQSGKVYLFDSTGKYLNSVGEVGRGPNEYLVLSDMIIEETGAISIYSYYQGMLYTYTPEGRFLGTTEFHYKSGNYAKANGLNYFFFGDGGGMPFQLYISNDQNQAIDSFLVASNVPYMSTSSPAFTHYNGGLNLCLRFGGDVYRLINGTPTIAYQFDFGEYAIPNEYYNMERNDAYAFVMSKTVAIKELFFENRKYAVLHAGVCNFQQDEMRHLYGVLGKEKRSWEWYFMNNDDFMNSFNLKYMDDSYLYFTAEPILMKETALIDRFPILSSVTEDDGIVILKCRLKGIGEL